MHAGRHAVLRLTRRSGQDVDNPHGEHGDVLIAVLSLTLCAAMLAAALQTAVLYALRSESLHVASESAAWLARGEAVQAITAIKGGNAHAGTTKLAAPNGWTVQTLGSGTTWTVQECAHSMGALASVQASVQASSGAVVDWEEGVPGCT